MTRTFNAKAKCLKCGSRYTLETEFERWFRDHKDLRSESGIVRFDLDVLVHRYMFGDRSRQAMMFVEVKSHGATWNDCQKDTFGILGQFINGSKECFSVKNGEKVAVRGFGCHLLVFENETPLDSEWIEWDTNRIDVATLVQILRFELSPISLRPWTWE